MADLDSISRTNGNNMPPKQISEFRWKTVDYVTGIGWSIGAVFFAINVFGHVGSFLIAAVVFVYFLFDYVKDAVHPAYAMAGLVTGYALLYGAMETGLLFPYVGIVFLCLFAENWILGIGDGSEQP